MSDTVTLAAEKRERTGSRYSQRARSAGMLPAVVYGHKENPVSVTLDSREALSHIMKGEKVFELDIQGAKQHVILKDLGYDYLGNNIIHADFARVDLNERIDVRAHLEFVGDAAGLSTVGALMMHPLTEVELNCVVTNIPSKIEVDVSGMEVGDVIHASDVKLPLDTMNLVTDSDAIVAQIILKKLAADPDDAEASEVSSDDAQPEVIAEKKDEEAS